MIPFVTIPASRLKPESRGAARTRKTTTIYTHVLNRGGLAVRSPLDEPLGRRKL